jgi:hypothetical protein
MWYRGDFMRLARSLKIKPSKPTINDEVIWKLDVKLKYKEAQQLFDLGYQFGTKTQEDIFLKKSRAK